ncbi:MAG: hypothetical protein R2882_04460 [Gemmatimonadales bacterium]
MRLPPTRRLDGYGPGPLYELLSGWLPHGYLPGESDADYRHRLAAGAAPDPLAVPDATAADPRFPMVARLVHGALEPDPARRVPGGRRSRDSRLG